MAMIYEAAAANLENITDYFVKTLLKDKNMFEIIKKANSIKLKIFKVNNFIDLKVKLTNTLLN